MCKWSIGDGGDSEAAFDGYDDDGTGIVVTRIVDVEVAFRSRQTAMAIDLSRLWRMCFRNVFAESKN